ncbi:hypothetical protein F3J23_14615 [Chryseobacterium sp. Tr-659]|uniref:hypothetical protein n=1 Tax=Chryseobacterium sp. Tr-659 TaxID=2608340 RepID=UPI00142358D7|nr:hypothetical protein [Chryseobacterium sp. Tr-659]NIF06680.1 hypothetical protein [Chryseobacterium sp. Tr-659]
MKKLKQLIDRCKHRILNDNQCPMLIKVKDDYKRYYEIAPEPSFKYMGKMNNKTGMEIADAYTLMEHSPDDPFTKASYGQLKEEVLSQFNFLNLKENITYEPFYGKGEPYKDSYEMLVDIHNSHLFFYKTEDGFGENNISSKNVMLEKTGIKSGNYEFLVNDIFRIVHDIFGHAMYGFGFGAIGEDLAWHTHMQMFSPLAGAALTTETRGQNCWVNFGAHMRNEEGKLFEKNEVGFIPPQKRPFAEQKMGLLPYQISGVRVYDSDNGTVNAKLNSNWDSFLGIAR